METNARIIYSNKVKIYHERLKLVDNCNNTVDNRIVVDQFDMLQMI